MPDFMPALTDGAEILSAGDFSGGLAAGSSLGDPLKPVDPIAGIMLPKTSASIGAALDEADLKAGATLPADALPDRVLLIQEGPGDAFGAMAGAPASEPLGDGSNGLDPLTGEGSATPPESLTPTPGQAPEPDLVKPIVSDPLLAPGGSEAGLAPLPTIESLEPLATIKPTAPVSAVVSPLGSPPATTLSPTIQTLAKTANAISPATQAATLQDATLFAVPENFTSGVFTVGKAGTVGVDFLFDGGAYKGELGIFSLLGMENLSMTSTDFIREAATRAISGSQLGHVVIADRTEGARFGGPTSEGGIDSFNTGDYLGLKTFQMTAGDKFALILSPDGTLQRVANDPTVGGSLRPLFSLAPANPQAAFQTARIADITGDGQAFAMEDLRLDGHSDRDYNDLVFQFRGATGRVEEVVVDSGKLPDEVRAHVTDTRLTILTTDPLPGKPVELEFRIQNSETSPAAGPGQFNFYISKDDVMGNADDVFLGRYTSPVLDPGGSTGLIKGNVQIPSSFYPFWNQIGDGQYYIGMAPVDLSKFTTEAILQQASSSLNIDLAGEQPSVSRLGYPASLQGRTYLGSIGGNDPTDYYSIKVGMSSAFTLSLSDIVGNVDVEVLDSQSRVLARGSASSQSPLDFGKLDILGTEFSTGNLELKGGQSYYVKLTSPNLNPTSYRLALKSTPKNSNILSNASDELIYSAAILDQKHPKILELNETTNNRTMFDFLNLMGTAMPGIQSTLKVAVLDTGINANGFSFEDNGIRYDVNPLRGRVSERTSYIEDETLEDGTPRLSDHGSNIAGIIAGSLPGRFMGIFPQGQLVDIKVLAATRNGDQATPPIPGNPIALGGLTNVGTKVSLETGLQEVIDLIDAGEPIAVVNLSLATNSAYTDSSIFDGLNEEMADLRDRGVLVIAAAGNDYKLWLDNTATNPNAREAGKHRISSPANYGLDPVTYPNVIGVGAVSQFDGATISAGLSDSDKNIVFFSNETDGNNQWGSPTLRADALPGTIAPFSNRSPNIIFAPGVQVQGAGYTSLTAMSGTSQATAVMSGVALYAQEYALKVLGRLLTPTEFRELLMSTAGRAVINEIDPSVIALGVNEQYPLVDASALLRAINDLRKKTAPLELTLRANQAPIAWQRAKFIYEFSRSEGTISVQTKVAFYDDRGTQIGLRDLDSRSLPQLSTIASEAFWPLSSPKPAIVVGVERLPKDTEQQHENQIVSIQFGNGLSAVNYELDHNLSLVQSYNIKGDTNQFPQGDDNPNVTLTMNSLRVQFSEGVEELPIQSSARGAFGSVIPVIPQTRTGDGEFNANGPLVKIEVKLEASGSSVQVLAKTSFREVDGSGLPINDTHYSDQEWQEIGFYQDPLNRRITDSMILNERRQSITTIDAKSDWANFLKVDLSRYPLLNLVRLEENGDISFGLRSLSSEMLLALLRG